MNQTLHNPSMPHAGKTALVTGGSRSIGAAIARRLARDGAKVVLTYAASPAKADAVVTDIVGAGGVALAVKADNGVEAEVRLAVATAVERFGSLDILVNNAGMSVLGPPEAIRMEDLDRMWAVNVRGPFVAIQAALAHLKAGGRIINIGSSMTAYSAFPTASVYTMTKGAIAGMTRGMARDLGARGITINNLMPGPVDSDMNPSDGPVADVVRPGIAVKRFGEGRDIAAVVSFLASEDAAFVTGTDILVDGGFTS
jgi:3-oxoacyl-[acyl-carrier protein] reductase